MNIPDDPTSRSMAESLYAVYAEAFTDGDPTTAVARSRDALSGGRPRYGVGADRRDRAGGGVGSVRRGTV